MKRKIVELVAIRKKERNTSTKNPKRPILSFWNNEKVRGIPNEIFPLVITTKIANFEVFRVLINDGNSCGIMYSNIFKKMGLKK